MNHIKQLAGQTAIYGLGIVIPRFLNLLLTPFYTRILPPEEYGIITELYSYVIFLLVILTYGLETGYFRFASDKFDKNNVYKTSLVSILSSTLIWIFIVIIFYKEIANVLGYGSFSIIILYLGIIVGIDAFTSIPMAKIRIENKALKYAIIRIMEVSVNIGLNLFFLVYCERRVDEIEWIRNIYNPENKVLYIFISNLVASSTKLILLAKEIFITEGGFNLKLWNKILQYSYPLLFAGLAGAVNEALDRPLLKLLTQPPEIPLEVLGIYGANFKLAVLMTIFIQMFRYAAEPFFFSKMNDINAKSIYADIMKFFVVATLIVFLGVTLYIDIFKYFIGPDYRSALDIVPIVLFANILMGIYYNLSVWFKLTNRTKYGAIMVFIGAIVTVVINVLFVPKYSYYASAWGHFFAYFFMVLISLFLGRRFYRIDYDWGRIIFYAIIAIVIFGIFKYMNFNNMVIEYLFKTLAIIVYLAIFVWKENLLELFKLKNT